MAGTTTRSHLRSCAWLGLSSAIRHGPAAVDEGMRTARTARRSPAALVLTLLVTAVLGAAVLAGCGSSGKDSSSTKSSSSSSSKGGLSGSVTDKGTKTVSGDAIEVE